MLAAKKNWKLKRDEYSRNQIASLAAEAESSEAFAKLCLQRGLDTADKISDFVSSADLLFHDPFLMHDMGKAVGRINEAIEAGEKIVVYGDYDADGITSTAILVEAIEMLGGNVSYYLPNRFSDGYGPNEAVFAQLAEEGAALIITCDNGVSGHEAIETVQAAGIDVVVTDHHELPPELPSAYAIVHPRHPEGNYPFGDLSGAGVALKVVSALLETIPEEFFDLAAIGTVADLVSLRDENRWIVRKGIQALQFTERLGLQLLYEKAGLQPEQLDEESIGFILGPRLNALGRLGDANPGVELLLSFEEERLHDLVELIQTTNGKRQQLVQEIFHSAREKLDEMPELPSVVVLADETWHEGVMGIVASRLVEETGRPVLLFHTDPKTGISKGSGRSISSFNLFEALSACSDHLLKFGGHHMAAGMSARAEELALLSECLNRYAEPMQAQIQQGEKVEVAEMLPLASLTLDFLKEVELLKPFGTDNEKPIFGIEDVEVQTIRAIGTDNRHLKMSVASGSKSLDIIGFNKGSLTELLNEKDKISAIGELSINTWRDISKPQMELKDIKSDEVSYIDRRGSSFSQNDLKMNESVYLFFNRRLFEKYSSAISDQSAAVLLEGADSIPPFPENMKNAVVFDCPDNLEHLKLFFQEHEFEDYYFFCYPVDPARESGMPNKEEFARLYRYVSQRKNMDIGKKMEQMAIYLKIDKNLLIFMLQVFLEAKFVTINDGILNPLANPDKRNLEDTEAFQNRLKKIEAEELFAHRSFSNVMEWMDGLK